MHIPHILLAPSDRDLTGKCGNGSATNFLSMRLRRQEEKLVSIFYKINRTTVDKLLKKINSRVNMQEGISWYWDPVLYGGTEEGRVSFGIQLYRQDTGQTTWLDRPDAVISDWGVDSGVRALLRHLIAYSSSPRRLI